MNEIKIQHLSVWRTSAFKYINKEVKAQHVTNMASIIQLICTAQLVFVFIIIVLYVTTDHTVNAYTIMEMLDY
jgi:hypothetical protein